MVQDIDLKMDMTLPVDFLELKLSSAGSELNARLTYSDLLQVLPVHVHMKVQLDGL